MRKFLICLIYIILSLLPGCWDSIDIEERVYVLGVAIDEYHRFLKAWSREPTVLLQMNKEILKLIPT